MSAQFENLVPVLPPVTDQGQLPGGGFEQEQPQIEGNMLDEIYDLGGDIGTGGYTVPTAAENQARLNEAADFALEAVGLYSVPRQEWSQQETINYLAYFRGLILQSPWQFTADTVTMAQNMNLNRPGYGLPVFGAGSGLDVSQAIGIAMQSAAETARPLLEIPQNVGNLALSLTTALNNAARAVSDVARSPISTPIVIGVLGILLLSQLSGPAHNAKGIFQ